MAYQKVRFYSKRHGVTAGLIIHRDRKTLQTVDSLSRLFPVSEAPKMERLQASPLFDTWDEAFAFEFAPIPA